jgi:DNA adenine methylase
MPQLAPSPGPLVETEAHAHLSPTPRPSPSKKAQPIVKWAGGKTRLLKELTSRLPTRFERYFEPFFGGGAFFFALQPQEALLSDVNYELVLLYRCVRDDLSALIAELQHHPYEKEHYYWMRSRVPETLSDVERAARTLYLNRTCFNGLYRVNRRGQFNVPMGRYSNPVICNVDRLERASLAFSKATLTHADFNATMQAPKAGDFVYFDPPYQPISKTANFTSYTAGSFGEEDQARLADTVTDLANRGVQCMLSNSDTPLIQSLYKDFRVDIVMAPRLISRKASNRRPVREVIVRTY